eukprot:TRINITY_DN788_c0_g1_i6.p1 TRINITY_DN788_c0_g1~~TRINITY_DN788_c0_g1_i6.p1  ORF type:complete len:108 (-),score=27.26 TRINITY_DN788_c0_g1_i6:7-330(-)
MYAMNDQSSFDNLQVWLEQLSRFASDGMLMCILCNTRQPSKHVVNATAGKELAKTLNSMYYEIDTDQPSKVILDEMAIAIATRLDEVQPSSPPKYIEPPPKKECLVQ